MSELKALWIPTRSGNSLHCYLKSEAYKVIAKLESEITQLEKQSSCKFSDDCLRVRQLKRELRRQKYKQCIDKANYWVAVSYQCVDDKHRQRATKHHYKWLEIAEKFKEAK
jgi:hypothetical protein